MTKSEITAQMLKIYHETPGNVMTEDLASHPEIVGLRIYDEPLIGFGSAEDALFRTYKTPGIVGPWMLEPGQWLPSARTVVSFFLPYSEQIKTANSRMKEFACLEWAYGRVEGQAFIGNYLTALRDYFAANGADALAPSRDPRFFSIVGGKKKGAAPTGEAGDAFYPGADADTFSSNWSERHAAFVCGLGTFGLSRGLITKKGIAGRFGSILISPDVEPDRRPYTEIYEYCTRCGACAGNCPAHAFPAGGLKDHRLCCAHVQRSAEVLKPRYGCGLCQVNTPCRDGIPSGK